MTIIGIDADTQRLAYALLQNGAAKVGTLDRTNTKGRFEEDWDYRLRLFFMRAYELCAMVYLEGIYLAEDINSARNVETHRLLANVQGEILAAARVAGVPVVIVLPQTWHARVLGLTRGREALKALAMAKAGEYVAGELSQHEADALCVALYGLQDSTAEAAG